MIYKLGEKINYRERKNFITWMWPTKHLHKI